MSTNPEHWTYDQFLTFLLIYASYADLDFSLSERKAILSRVDSSTFDEVNKLYEQLGEFERLDLIIKGKPTFYPDQIKKSELLNAISEHFYADGTVSKLELITLDFLDRLM